MRRRRPLSPETLAEVHDAAQRDARELEAYVRGEGATPALFKEKTMPTDPEKRPPESEVERLRRVETLAKAVVDDHREFTHPMWKPNCPSCALADAFVPVVDLVGGARPAAGDLRFRCATCGKVIEHNPRALTQHLHDHITP